MKIIVLLFGIRSGHDYPNNPLQTWWNAIDRGCNAEAPFLHLQFGRRPLAHAVHTQYVERPNNPLQGT